MSKSLYERILNCITERKSEYVSNDGWLDESIEFEEEQLKNISGPCLRLSLDLSLSSKILISEESIRFDDTDVLNRIKKNMAMSVHQKLYGDIISDLNSLRSMVNYGDRDASLNQLSKIMEKLDVN